MCLRLRRDVIEHEPFAQRQIAQRQFGARRAAGRSCPAARRRRPRGPRGAASRPGSSKPLAACRAPTTCLRRRCSCLAETRVAKLSPATEPDLRPPRRPQAENGAGCPDHAAESGGGDLVEILVDFRVNVLHELAFVPARDRVAADEALGQADDAELEAPARAAPRSARPSVISTLPPPMSITTAVPGHSDAVHGGQMDQARLFGPGNHPRR